MEKFKSLDSWVSIKGQSLKREKEMFDRLLQAPLKKNTDKFYDIYKWYVDDCKNAEFKIRRGEFSLRDF